MSFQKIKNKIKIIAGTNTIIAVSLAYLLGLLGLLRGRRGSIDHIKSTISLSNRSAIISGLPVNITIEPTNMCNLKCSVCETGAGLLGREKGCMTLERFKVIIDKIALHVNTLMFYFMGEPFLNRHAYDMIRYAKKKGIPFVDTCTNGDIVNPAELVSCGIDRICFQIGGITQETHQVYRINSNLERVLDNIKETLRLRREHGSDMQVESGFILMKHNEHEVSLYKKYMFDLGVDRALIVDPCVRSVEQGHEMLPNDKRHWIYDPSAFIKGVLRPKNSPNNICPWVYYSMVILVSGDIVPCCRDATGKFVMGNILQQNLEDIWNGEKYLNFRECINKNQKSLEICRLCSSYPASVIN